MTGDGLALEGVRVLAVEHFVAGPYASMWLADHGAQVIKIEHPGSGEQAREVGPFKETASGEVRSLGLIRSNRNKHSLTLDLKQPEGVELFKRLVREVDVVVENLRADSMAKLGLGYHVLREVNPALIYTSVSGFGHDDVLPGPNVSWPAFDVIVQALSGLMFRPEREGTRPVYLGFPLADLFAAALAYAGTVQALYHRTRTGRGQHVDISMYDGGIVLNELALATRSTLGQVPDSGTHFQAAPFGAYRVSDGYLSIAVFSEKNWRNFCEIMGHPELIDDDRFKSGRMRAHRYEEIREIVEGWLSAYTTSGSNPQTGPFYIEGAQPGDMIAVTFHRIETNRASAYSGTLISAYAIDPGYLRSAAAETETRREIWALDKARGVARTTTDGLVGGPIEVPMRPMLGCVGVAPGRKEAIGTTTPGNFGGNMDYAGLVQGVTVMLPVYEPGALLFIGDGHAAQGHGEVVGTGLETSMDVEFSVQLVKGKAIAQPRLENEDYLMVVASARPLLEAFQRATTELMQWLRNDYGMDERSASMLLGVAAEYEIANVVDPAFTVVAKIDRARLPAR